MKSFRLDEDTCYTLEAIAEEFDASQADVIAIAVEWLCNSGAKEAIADMKYKNTYKGYRAFKEAACSDGEIRSKIRTSNHLGIAPMTRPALKPFQQYELDSFLGDFASEYDIEAIIEDATTLDYKSGKRYWKQNIDLNEICAEHEK